MSDCLTTAQIHDFLHDALSPDDEARVHAHLAECPSCRKEVEKHRRNKQQSPDIAKAGAWADRETLDDDAVAHAHVRARESIEGYEILSEIHRGGQGIVYKAVQKATKRTVALKVLLSGAYGSSRQRYRFEREVDLVASLEHPNIVTIFDSGVSRDGQPYFAMEYVHGQELDAYLATADLPMDAKLRLFQRICDAVGHAHLRGVIHRDLKPGNIRIDANGEPHVLDFGLAKAAGSALIANVAPATMTGEFMGTLQYASPEQTKGDPKLIDLRTDVYSLGVVLYEMLTQSHPYSVVGRLDEAIKTIVEVEPKKPSTVNRKIGNEVETIVLKALAKDPERRYHSAASLAEDIRRFLAGEPIEAKRESRVYILKKTLAHYKRHAVVAAAVLILLSLVGTVALHFRSQAVHQREMLAKRREGQRLVAKAILLVDQRIRLPHAKTLLNEALHVSPNLEQAHLYRGLLHAIDGLDALVEEKTFWVDRAVADYYSAHVGSGGRPLNDKSDTDPTTHDTGGGSRAALLSAANLLLAVNRRDEAQEYLSLATFPDPAERRLVKELAVGHAVPYDLGKDPLVLSRSAISRAPETARMDPDTEAVLRRILHAGVYSLDPLLARSQDKYVSELMFDRLFKIDEDLQVIPNNVVVRDITVSEDRLVWDIRLHPALTWHDGVAFTAHDVAFSWNQYETLQDLVHKAKDAPWDAPLVHVEAIGREHIRIVHKSAVATQRWDMTFDLIPEHRFDALAAENPQATFEELHKRFGRAPVGNGPYRWSKSEPDRIVVLQRWEEYPGERPYFASVEFRIMPDRNERINALADGATDALELNASEFRWFVNGESFRGRIAKAVYPSRLYEYICWNADGSNTFFDDRRVRQAMTCAINLGWLREQRFGGLYSPCLGIYQVGSWMCNREIVPFQYDPDRSRALLDEAGWRTEKQGHGIRKRAGRRFEFSLLVPEVSPDTRSLAYDLQVDLREVGVAMNIEIAPWKECLARMRDHEFEAFCGAVQAGVHPDVDKVRWRTAGAKNYAGYSNPEVDRLYERARRTTSRSTQRAYYQKIQELIYQDQPYTFLWHKPTLWAFNKRLRGVTSSPVGVAGFDPGPRGWWLPRGGE